MEALACSGVVHRDLSLGNTLFCHFDPNNVVAASVEVSDFGLSVTLSTGIHQTVAGGTQPTRCMAPELLEHDQCSEYSDVWGYRITDTELLSRGAIPYFYITLDDAVVSHVVQDEAYPVRCARLQYPALDSLWRVLVTCRRFAPRTRPTFVQLSVRLGQLSAISECGTKISCPVFQGYVSVPSLLLCGHPITPLVPLAEGAHLTFRMEPDVPTGLALDTSTGVVSGTPDFDGTRVSDVMCVNRTDVAANSAGSAYVTLKLELHRSNIPSTRVSAFLDAHELTLGTTEWK